MSTVDAGHPGEALPLVTIGLPVYNNERHIGESIESLLAQTYRDFVLIISDNASTDDTAVICRSYASGDPRVRYTRNDINIGMSGNYNLVFEQCRTKYFKWATADDLSGPEMLADAVAVMEDDPSIAICYPRTIIIDEDSLEQGRYHDELHLMQDDPAERFVGVVENIGLVHHHLGLMRSDAMRQTHMLGKHVGADIGFVAEMSLYGKFYEVKEYQFFRRFHEDSSSWSRDDNAQQARRFHAAGVRRVPFGTLLFHESFWRAVMRAPLGLRAKLGLLGYLCKQLYWDRRNLCADFRHDVRGLLRPRGSESRAGRS